MCDMLSTDYANNRISSSPTHNSEIDPPPLFSLLLLSLHRSLVEATCHLSDLLESVFVVCVADLQLLDAHLHDSFQ